MQSSKERPVFLSARWQYLAMANYVVPAELLAPYVPKGTELDLWKGQAIVSLVGFMFNDTKVFGLRWPFHTHFEEVNLRLYIKRKDGDVWKRGVAFVSEIVPKPIIAIIANKLYNEHYSAMPMRHQIQKANEMLKVSYEWKHRGKWNRFGIEAKNNPLPVKVDSEEWFIFEHYWGYNQLDDHTTVEYGVEHPKWLVYPVKQFDIECDFTGLYGKEWQPYLEGPPHSVMIAYGSEVLVRKPVKIPV